MNDHPNLANRIRQMRGTNNFHKTIRIWSNLEHSYNALMEAMATNTANHKILYQASLTNVPVTIPTNVEAELFDQASKQKKQFDELDNFLRTTEVFVEAARYYSKTILPR